MSRIARLYFDLNYEANMQMKCEYEELLVEIKDLEKKFQVIADELNEDWTCYIALNEFEIEDEFEDDPRYKKITNIYKQINELKEQRNNLKNELKHAKVL